VATKTRDTRTASRRGSVFIGTWPTPEKPGRRRRAAGTRGIAGKSKKGRRPRTRPDVPTFEWPSFFDGEKAHFLSKRLFSAARNDVERQLFMSILRSQYDKGAELASLYRELPGLFAGDRNSAKNFRYILNRLTQRTAHDSRTVRSFRSAETPGPSAFAGDLPCPGHSFFIGPDRLMSIIDGVHLMTRGDRGQFTRCVETLSSARRQLS
jgi:hypothetical protein